MVMNYYNMMRYLYNVNSQYKRANNMLKIMYGYMTPQHMIYEEYKDEMIKRFLFG